MGGNPRQRNTTNYSGTMEDFKLLNKYQKLAEIQDLNLIRAERKRAAIYLQALRKEDKETITYFEQFGHTARHILMNERAYNRGLIFGFNEIKLNEYGWLENAIFLDKETIEFPHREGWAVSNHITIAKGNNDKYTYCLSYSYNTGGGGYGLTVWGKVFNTRKECLIYALNDIKERLNSHSSDTDKYTKSVLKQIKLHLDEQTGRKAIQLSLFDM